MKRQQPHQLPPEEVRRHAQAHQAAQEAHEAQGSRGSHLSVAVRAKVFLRALERQDKAISMAEQVIRKGIYKRDSEKIRDELGRTICHFVNGGLLTHAAQTCVTLSQFAASNRDAALSMGAAADFARDQLPQQAMQLYLDAAMAELNVAFPEGKKTTAVHEFDFRFVLRMCKSASSVAEHIDDQVTAIESLAFCIMIALHKKMFCKVADFYSDLARILTVAGAYNEAAIAWSVSGQWMLSHSFRQWRLSHASHTELVLPKGLTHTHFSPNTMSTAHLLMSLVCRSAAAMIGGYGAENCGIRSASGNPLSYVENRATQAARAFRQSGVLPPPGILTGETSPITEQKNMFVWDEVAAAGIAAKIFDPKSSNPAHGSSLGAFIKASAAVKLAFSAPESQTDLSPNQCKEVRMNFIRGMVDYSSQFGEFCSMNLMSETLIKVCVYKDRKTLHSGMAQVESWGWHHMNVVLRAIEKVLPQEELEKEE